MSKRRSDQDSTEEQARNRRAAARAQKGESLDTIQHRDKLAGRQRPPPKRSLEDVLARAGATYGGLVVGALPAHVEVLPDESLARGGVSRADVRVVRVHPALVAELASPLVVGDHVTVAELDGGQPYAVVAESRSTLLSRPAVEREKHQQPIVANAGILWAVVALANPAMRPGLVDRFFVAASAGGLEPRILATKADLASEDGTEEWLQRYEAMGFVVVRTSAQTGLGLDEARRRFADGFSVLVGQSGVGKSSMVRAILPAEPIAVGEVSTATGKGRHTTTVTRYYRLPDGGAVVDTPGLRELGLWNATRAHLDEAFPDVARFAEGCRFANCRHDTEPGCAVRGEPSLHPERLASHRKLGDEIDQRQRPGFGKPGGPTVL